MADNLIGLVGADFVILAADTAQSRSIMKLKDDEDKIIKLDNYKLLAGSGPQGDRTQFSEYIQKNIALYELRQGIPLSTHAAANYTRGELAEALRSNPFQINSLIAGYDKEEGFSLYYLDYLAALNKQDYACQGYAGHFLLGLLDKHYKKGMTLDEGLSLIRLCVDQLKRRFVLDTTSFAIKVVVKEGCRTLEPIKK